MAGSAQFIPQPMGYNPDSNSDGFVGAEDLMGLLSLYGTPYDNGDSVDVVTLDFTGVENDTLSVPEGADVIYLLSGDSVTQYNDRYVLLPSGTSWKSLVFFGFSSFNESCLYRFISSGSFFDEGNSQLYVWRSGYFAGAKSRVFYIRNGVQNFTSQPLRILVRTSSTIAKSRRKNAII